MMNGANISGSELAQTVIQRPKSAEPKPLPFGGFNRPSSTNLFGVNNQNMSAPLFESNSSIASDGQNTTPSQTSMESISQPPMMSPGATQTFTSAPLSIPSNIPSLPQKSMIPLSMMTDASSQPPKSTPSPFAFSSTPPSTARNPDVAPPVFNFGTPPSTSVSDNVPSPVLPFSSKPPFGSEVVASKSPEVQKNPFGFIAPPSTPPAGAEKTATPIFGNAAVASPNFSFGANAPVSTSDTRSPAFGGSLFGFASSPRPVTPPQEDKEVRMDESPTRDLNNKSDVVQKPANSFSFGTSGSSAFGQNNNSNLTSSFAFGGAPSPNPFENKVENKSTGFSFNRIASAPVTSAGFSFGQKQTGSTPATSVFGSQPSAFGQNTSSGSPFSFGATSSTNPFGQVSSTTPSSPQQFQPSTSTPFSFTPPSMPNNPFNFSSSQPSSPQLGGNSTAPQSPSTSGSPFVFGQSTNNQQSSSSGSLFNIGTAPPPTTTTGSGSTPRQMKKLPKRGAPGRR